MEQIANESGVGVATVYRHFGDKDNLVWTFIDEMSPRTIAHNLLLETSDDITSDLKNFAIAVIPSFYENRDIMRLILTNNESEKAYIEYLRKGSDRVFDRLANYFKTQIKAGNLQSLAKPQELSLTFLGMIFSFTVIAPVNYGMDLKDPERIGNLIVQIFLDGLKTQAMKTTFIILISAVIGLMILALCQGLDTFSSGLRISWLRLIRFLPVMKSIFPPVFCNVWSTSPNWIYTPASHRSKQPELQNLRSFSSCYF